MSNGETIDELVERVATIKCHACHSEVNVARALPFATVKCPECAEDLPVPALMGNFILFREIGKGAMGAVYQAFDTTLKRHVAIKVVLKSLGDDPSFVENFMQEAQALAALNHVNVVQIYSCGTEKGQPYIVMELIEGDRLDQMMSEDAPMNEKRLLGIAQDVIHGLQAAHEIGLIHGDIKPQNILVDQRGTAKVVDFGLARNAENDQVATEIWGTPYYIAPEKARRQREDHRADIYCLGATLFHALTNRPPFEGETARDVVMKRLNEPAPSVQEFRPELNDGTAQMIARMLETEVSRRYPTYDSLISDLNRALHQARQGPRKVDAAKTRKGKGSKGVWVFLFLLIAGLGAAAYFLLSPGPSEAPEAPQGRYVNKLVNGRIVQVFVPFDEEKASSTANAAESAAVPDGRIPLQLPVSEGEGKDAVIRSKAPRSNFGAEPSLAVSGSKTNSSKAYFLFDLSPVNLFKSDQPSVIVQFAEAYDGETHPSQLQVWGLLGSTALTKWTEGEGGENRGFSGPITWNNAPANDAGSPYELDDGAARIFLRTTINQKIDAGGTVKLVSEEGDDTFLEFLQDDQDKRVTLVITQFTTNAVPPFVLPSIQHPDLEPLKMEFIVDP